MDAECVATKTCDQIAVDRARQTTASLALAPETEAACATAHPPLVERTSRAPLRTPRVFARLVDNRLTLAVLMRQAQDTRADGSGSREASLRIRPQSCVAIRRAMTGND
ncbi:MAG: hypothetical protein DWH97_06035 [Planctomycetota bacterium]|nr:MAG: hypothetical protein DWH97_06035 [Planctomycetota bacterium]RLS92720.1 MAG: hypothetical protein DWI12_10665 [Planctomycetota bacterium]